MYERIEKDLNLKREEQEFLIMKEIRKPKFMQAAAVKRGHGIFGEICIAIALFIVGSMAGGIIQVPAMRFNMLGNNEYIKMITSGQPDINKMMQLISDMPEWMTIVTLISEVLLIVIVCLYCRFVEKRKLNTLGFKKKGAVLNYLKGMFFALVIFSVAYLICIVTKSITFDGLTQNIPVVYIVGYFIGYMIQGMAEEVLCRGYLFVSLTRRYHVINSAIFSAVFFAMLHGMNVGVDGFAIFNLFLYGLFAALLFADCENIWIVGAFHSVWNFVQGNLYGISVSGNKITSSIFTSTAADGGATVINGGTFGMEGGFAVTIVLIIAIVVIGKHLESKGKLIEKSEQPSQNEIEFEELKKEMESQMGMSDDDIFGNPNGYDKNRDVKDIFSSNPNSANAGSDGAFEKQENPNQYQKINVKDEQKEEKKFEKTGFDSNYFGS